MMINASGKLRSTRNLKREDQDFANRLLFSNPKGFIYFFWALYSAQMNRLLMYFLSSIGKQTHKTELLRVATLGFPLNAVCVTEMEKTWRSVFYAIKHVWSKADYYEMKTHYWSPFSNQEDIFRLIWKEVIDWKSVSKQRKLHEMKL